jgi:hypothetical protein
MSLVKAARRALLSAEGYNVERALAVQCGKGALDRAHPGPRAGLERLVHRGLLSSPHPPGLYTRFAPVAPSGYARPDNPRDGLRRTRFRQARFRQAMLAATGASSPSAGMTCWPRSPMVSMRCACSSAPPFGTKTIYSTPVVSRSFSICSPTSSGVPTTIAPAAMTCNRLPGTLHRRLVRMRHHQEAAERHTTVRPPLAGADRAAVAGGGGRSRWRRPSSRGTAPRPCQGRRRSSRSCCRRAPPSRGSAGSASAW